MLPLDKAKQIYKNNAYLDEFASFLAECFLKKEVPRTPSDYVNDFLNTLYGEVLTYTAIGKVEWEINSIKKVIKKFLKRKRNTKKAVLLIKHLPLKVKSEKNLSCVIKVGDVKLKIVEEDKPLFNFKRDAPVLKLRYNRKTKSGILNIVGSSIYIDSGRRWSYFSEIKHLREILNFGEVYVLKCIYLIERKSKYFYTPYYGHSSYYSVIQYILIDTNPFQIALAYPIWYSDTSDVSQLLKRIKPLNDKHTSAINEIKKKIRRYLRNSQTILKK